MIKQSDYIVIQADMITELGLSGNRLLIYALIHGFCKDGEHEFHGSINYICEWTNLSRQTVLNVLKSLVDDGLLFKRTYVQNNIKFCAYTCYKRTIDLGSQKIRPLVKTIDFEGSQKTLPNNNIFNIDSSSNNKESNNQDNNISCTKNEKDENFERCWIAYHRKGSKKKAKMQWDKLSDDERSKVLQHIDAYTSEREIQYQQDFERYLRDKTFNTVVYGKGNKVIYDPSSEQQITTTECQNKDSLVIGGQVYK